MSTLSHNRGKESTHDHDQNTPQTLCTQRNREALVNTSLLHQILTRFELWPGWKPRSSIDSCLSTIESDPLQVKTRHHPEVWRQTHVTSRSTLKVLTRRPAPEVLPRPSKKANEDLQVHPQENYPNTTATSLLCKKANDQVISPQERCCFSNKWLTASINQ